MLVFIDESGHPRPNDSTKNPVLVGVCIHENDIKPITNRIYKLKETLYGKQDEVKSTKLIRPYSIMNNRTINKSFVEGLIDLVCDYNTAVFSIVMERPDDPIVTPDMHLPRQYYLMLRKIEYYSAHFHFGKALMIFDGIHEKSDRQIANALTGFLFRTKQGRSFRHILEMPLFVSSAVTPAMQIADVFASIIRQYYENQLDTIEPTNDYQRWLVSLFNKIHGLVKNVPVPRKPFLEYGIQNIGKRYDYPVSKRKSISEKVET